MIHLWNLLILVVIVWSIFWLAVISIGFVYWISNGVYDLNRNLKKRKRKTE